MSQLSEKTIKQVTEGELSEDNLEQIAGGTAMPVPAIPGTDIAGPGGTRQKPALPVRPGIL